MPEQWEPAGAACERCNCHVAGSSLQARQHAQRERGARKQCCHVCVARVACDVSRIRVEAAIGIAVPGRQHVT